MKPLLTPRSTILTARIGDNVDFLSLLLNFNDFSLSFHKPEIKNDKHELLY